MNTKTTHQNNENHTDLSPRVQKLVDKTSDKTFGNFQFIDLRVIADRQALVELLGRLFVFSIHHRNSLPVSK